MLMAFDYRVYILNNLIYSEIKIFKLPERWNSLCIIEMMSKQIIANIDKLMHVIAIKYKYLIGYYNL